MWAASCLASCCAVCACEACCTTVGSIGRRSAWISYCGLFALSLLSSWVLREGAGPSHGSTTSTRCRIVSGSRPTPCSGSASATSSSSPSSPPSWPALRTRRTRATRSTTAGGWPRSSAGSSSSSSCSRAQRGRQHDKHEIASADSVKFQSVFSQVETLHQHVQKPRERIADAGAFLDITTSLAASVRSQSALGIIPGHLQL